MRANPSIEAVCVERHNAQGMKSQELRQAWIDYWVGKQHKLLPPATLIPHEMSTTLFTIAGMEQFVPVFLGEQPAPAPRAVTVQRCLRVAGAKSDIESVGRTGRHGTFLEMLGNFSFGDYYKREAIGWAWEFVTQVCVWIRTACTSRCTPATTKPSASGSTTSALDAARITRFDEDNFWTMGATGPCGPCTEIFYDTGEQYAAGPEDTGPNLGDRYVEIWNVVFQQYNRSSDGKLDELPRKSIDTGAGLERMLAVCNGVASMYDTDLFTDLVAAQPPVGQTSLDDRRTTRSPQHYRRSYACGDVSGQRRRLSLEYRPRFRAAISRCVARSATADYSVIPTDSSPASFPPSSRRSPAAIRSCAKANRASSMRCSHEEQVFDRTLERGLAMLERVIEEAIESNERVITGEAAFMLHDTYGFPLELTREVAAERGAVVDTVAFDRCMEGQRERARRDAASKRAVVTLADLPATSSEFTGYDEGLEGEGEIVAMLQERRYGFGIWTPAKKARLCWIARRSMQSAAARSATAGAS